VVVIQDQSLAKVFKMEFEEMWGNGTSGVFGPAKTDNTPHNLSMAVKLWKFISAHPTT
jgi:hypothetical protein